MATPDGGSVVCTNGHLHDEVLAHLAGEPPTVITGGEVCATIATARYSEVERHFRRNVKHSSVPDRALVTAPDTIDFAGRDAPRQVAGR